MKYLIFRFQVEAVVRQRDMYRVLLANTGQSPVSIRTTINACRLN